VTLALAKPSNMLYHRITLEYQRVEQGVHLIVSHLIWCPRRRSLFWKPIWVAEVKARGAQLIHEKYDTRGWTVLTLAIQPDHLPLLVRCYPSDSASEVVKECKGITCFDI